MHAERTWILIADAERARILLARGRGQALCALDGMNFHNEIPSRARKTNSPFAQAASQIRRLHPELPDNYREEILDFARFLANTLVDGWARKSFEHVVIVAPPAFLGDLRDEMPEHLASSIAAEIPRDLTRIPATELPRHLADALNI